MIFSEIKLLLWRTIGLRMHYQRNDFLLQLIKGIYLSFPKSNREFSLDLGCGAGDLTAKLSILHNLETIGVDLGKNNISKNLNYIAADASILPLNSNSFALVTAFSLIEHIDLDKRRSFYKEVKRVLRNDGVLMMQFPNRYYPIEQHSFLPFIGYLPAKLHRYFFYSFVSVPSKKEVHNDLIAHGFKFKIIEYRIRFFVFSNYMNKIFPFGYLVIATKSN
jgi:ubiquinone/menaquinone biosynthesis C-methylase UbiE